MWRFNSIVISLFIITIIGFVAFNVIKDAMKRKPPAVITNVAADPEGKERWVLGSIQDVEGTEWLFLPLVSEKKDVSLSDAGMRKGLHSYGDGYSIPSRNVLFVNQQTRDMHWLFPLNEQIVTKIETVSRLARYEKARIADAILYYVVTRDTNSDNRLSSDDMTDIAASRTDGTGYRVIAKSVDRIFGAKTANADQFILLYQSGGRGYLSVVRVSDLTVEETKEMPKSEKTP